MRLVNKYKFCEGLCRIFLSPGVVCEMKSIFKLSKTDLNSEFLFSKMSCLTKAKEQNQPYYLPKEIHPFPRRLAWREIQSHPRCRLKLRILFAMTIKIKLCVPLIKASQLFSFQHIYTCKICFICCIGCLLGCFTAYQPFPGHIMPNLVILIKVSNNSV